jgi:hypothetical protein
MTITVELSLRLIKNNLSWAYERKNCKVHLVLYVCYNGNL